MADERNLGVRITATDSATPAIRTLSQELERLQAIQRMGLSGAFATQIREEIAARMQQIEAVRAQIAILSIQTNATKAAADAARELRLEASLGPEISRQLQSAASSADVLAKSLSIAAASDATLRDAMQAGSAVTTTASAGFNKLVADLAGVKTQFLSATESAAVFSRELGAVGTKVETLTAAEFGRLVPQLAGVRSTRLPAAASAQVFQRELGEIGGGLTLTPAAGFSRMVADLAGVKQSLLSAKDSAAVFSAGIEEGSVHAQAGTAAVSREIRHVVAGVDELARGQRGAFFSTLGAAARDAGLGATALLGSVTGLVAIMAGAGIVRGAEAMGKWAQNAQAAAGASGLSINQFTRLDGAMQLLGGKTLGTDAALRGFARSVAQAAADPASKAAQAFHALGISQEDIVSHSKNVYDSFLLVASAWDRSNDSANKAAAGQIIFRNGLEHVEPLLNRGAQGAQMLADEAQRLGITLDDKTAAALEKTAEEGDKLSFTIHGKLIQAFVAWGPAIEHIISLLGLLGSALGNVATAGGQAATAIVNIASGQPMKGLPATSLAMGFAAGGVPLDLGPTADVAIAPQAARLGGYEGRGAEPRQRRDVSAVTGAATIEEQVRTAVLEAERNAIMGIKDVNASRLAGERAIVGVLKEQEAALTAQGAPAKEIERVHNERLSAEIRLHNTEISQGAIAVRKGYEDFAAAEREKIAEAGKDFKAITAIYNEWEAEARRLYGESSKQFQQVEREKVLAAEAAIREQIRVIRQGAQDVAAAQQTQALMARVAGIQGRAAPGQAADPGASIAAGELAAQQILAEGWKEIYDLEVVAAKAGAAGATDAQAEANREIVRTWNETIQKLIENFDKVSAAAKRSADEAARAYVQFFDKIGGQVETFGKSLIDAFVAPHTETVLQGIQYRTVSLRTQEIRTAFGKLVSEMSSDLFNALSHAISEALATTLVKNVFTNIQLEPGQGLGALFGKLVSSIFGGSSGQQPSASAFGLGQSSQTVQNFNSATTTATSSFRTLNQAVMQATQALQRMSGGGTGAVSGGSGDAGQGSVQQVLQQNEEQDASRSNTQALATVGAVSSMGSLVAAAVGGSAGRIISGLIGVLGLIANLLILLNVKPSFLGFTYAGGGIVPSAAGGMVTGGVGGQLAILHPREMVLPAHISQGIQNMIGSGSGGGSQNFAVSFNVSAVDSAGVDSFFKRNGPALANAFANQIRANNTGIMKNVKGLS